MAASTPKEPTEQDTHTTVTAMVTATELAVANTTTKIKKAVDLNRKQISCNESNLLIRQASSSA